MTPTYSAAAAAPARASRVSAMKRASVKDLRARFRRGSSATSRGTEDDSSDAGDNESEVLVTEEALLERARRAAQEGSNAEAGHEEVRLEDMASVGSRILVRSRLATGQARVPPTWEMVDAHGGDAAFISVLTRFYERLLADPFMRVLFCETAEERAPSEHASVLGTFLLGFIRNNNKYAALVRSGAAHGLGAAHLRAKRCPHRELALRGRGFTVLQSRAWIGHLDAAAAAFDMEPGFREALTNWLARRLTGYGPFVNDVPPD